MKHRNKFLTEETIQRKLNGERRNKQRRNNEPELRERRRKRKLREGKEYRLPEIIGERKN